GTTLARRGATRPARTISGPSAERAIVWTAGADQAGHAEHAVVRVRRAEQRDVGQRGRIRLRREQRRQLAAFRRERHQERVVRDAGGHARAREGLAEDARPEQAGYRHGILPPGLAEANQDPAPVHRHEDVPVDVYCEPQLAAAAGARDAWT